MEPTQVIIKPLLTEKSTWESEARNRYAFKVNLKANKTQVRHAIESLYGVRVEGVATQMRRGKYRRTRFGTIKTKEWKRAIVQLHEDDRIELL